MTKGSEERCGILVIQSMGIGDVLFAIPVLKALRRHYPDHHISFLTNLQNADLLSLVPEVDEIICYRRKTPAAMLQLLKKVRCRSYHIAVVLNPLLRGSLLAWYCGVPVRVGYLRDYERTQSLWGLGRLLLTHAYLPRDEKLHEVERYLDLLRMFGLTIRERERVPQLALTEETREFGQLKLQAMCDSHPGPLVIINPGAGWEMRRWPPDRFAAIGDWVIQQFGARVLFVGGDREVSLIDMIRNRMTRKAASLAGRTSLSQLAGLVAQCDVFLTNDTGALHIAAALDVPTIALFGPGDPVKVRPLSLDSTVVSHRTSCSPCQVQYTDRCRENVCMQQITVDEVKMALSIILQRVLEKKVVPPRGVAQNAL